MNKKTTMPYINVRDVVLYPGSHQALIIGRAFSLKAIRFAKEKNKGRLAVITQKKVEQNERPDKREMYGTGTVCQVMQSVELSDGSMKLLLKAGKRLKVAKVQLNGEVAFCEGSISESKTAKKVMPEKQKLEMIQLLKEWYPAIDAKEDNTHYRKLLREKNFDKFLQLLCCYLNVPITTRVRSRTPEEILKNPFPMKMSKKKNASINSIVSLRQKILEENNPVRKMALVKKVLKYEAAELVP